MLQVARNVLVAQEHDAAVAQWSPCRSCASSCKCTVASILLMCLVLQAHGGVSIAYATLEVVAVAVAADPLGARGAVVLVRSHDSRKARESDRARPGGNL